MTLFRVCTLVTDTALYDEMRHSFAQTGFDGSNCVFHPLDNTSSNRYEPYSGFNAVLETCREPYLLFCHQDIALNQGHGFTRLAEVVQDMNFRFPAWAVLGNAGIGFNLDHVISVTDPYTALRPQQLKSRLFTGPLPRSVVSLDENFLLVRTASGVRFSSQLRGFHFYGADLCLNALLRSNTCHVVDFQMTHFSLGNTRSDDFRQSRDSFAAYWSGKVSLRWFPTLHTTVYFSGCASITRLFSNARLQKRAGPRFEAALTRSLSRAFSHNQPGPS